MAVGAFVVAVAVVAVAMLGTLPRTSVWIPVLQEVLKIAYQALAIGALGGLAKLMIDRRSAVAASLSDLQRERRAFISAVIAASHRVDNARMLILANRSVLTWTRVVTEELVPARTQLRGLAHDLTDRSGTDQQLFASPTAIRECLQEMSNYVVQLIEEHADNKHALAELQRTAEESSASHRRDNLAAVWDRLLSLERLADFVGDGSSYGTQFREPYLLALHTMRAALSDS